MTVGGGKKGQQTRLVNNTQTTMVQNIVPDATKRNRSDNVCNHYITGVSVAMEHVLKMLR